MKNTIPESLLLKLHDASGSSSGGNKGFILASINANGDPTIIVRSENSCVHFALKKALEIFVDSEDAPFTSKG